MLAKDRIVDLGIPDACPPGEDSSMMRICLLGGFRVAGNGEALTGSAWRSQRVAMIIKLLALAPNYTLHREQIFEYFWPQSDLESASNNLRQTLHVARRQLSELCLDRKSLLHARGDLISLYPVDRVQTDVEQFEAAAGVARDAGDPAVYWNAIDLYSGPLLPDDLYEDWTTSRRESITAIYQALLDDVAQLHEVRGEYSRAITALRKLVAAEPSHEAAHVRLMQLYAATNRRVLALRQYDRLVRTLARELDAAPEAATQAVYDTIRTRQSPDPEGLRSYTSQPASQRQATNLPNPQTTFFGRSREVDMVLSDLTDKRIVTLTGPGGTGKTRLALEVARKSLDTYPDGVWLVELAGLSNAALVPETVTSALGIEVAGNLPPIETLTAVLRDASLLLILDNCEHLTDACAKLAKILITTCGDVRILATSRETLRLQGERSWSVPALPAPAMSAEFDAIAQNDAVRLFVDRVGWHEPGFKLTPDNADVIRTICRRLEGLPLALELAAARANVLTLPQLAARLDDALTVLTAGSRLAPDRQQTLRATLDWSYQLLTGDEQTLFQRLAVFAGGWTLDMAEAICADRIVPTMDILRLHDQLTLKSLLLVTLDEEQARYRFLEPVRQYALERLNSSGEIDPLRERHAEYFATLLEENNLEFYGPRQVTWFTRLEREHDNLRAALHWAIQRNTANIALRIEGVLWHYWGIRWHSSEGLKWIEATLSLPSAERSPLRARAILGAGELARRILDFDRSIGLLEEALDINRALGDPSGVAWSLAYLSSALGMAGRLDEARVCAQDSLELFRGLGDQLGMARALNALGEDARLHGDYETAARCYREALAYDRLQGEQQGIAVRLHNLGYVALHEGDVPRSIQHFRESFALDHELGYRTGPLSFLEGMGAAMCAADRPQTSARLYGAWEAHCALPGTEFKLHPPDQKEFDHYTVRAETLLGSQAFARAREAGRRLSLDQAIAEALAFEGKQAATRSGGSDDRQDETAARLTNREAEIALLVSKGFTNHQIADMLELAERTVDTHVSHILHKLGVSTRDQVAGRLAAPRTQSPTD